MPIHMADNSQLNHANKNPNYTTTTPFQSAASSKQYRRQLTCLVKRRHYSHQQEEARYDNDPDARLHIKQLPSSI
jgi:hypothetical protein